MQKRLVVILPAAALVLAVTAYALVQSEPNAGGGVLADTASPTLSPGACPPRPTPPVTYAPTPTPSSPTPSPGPTSRDVVIITQIPFCNDAGLAASDLHIQFAFPYSGASVAQNPPGCPAPTVDEGPPSFDRFSLDLDWGTDCVQSGDSVGLELVYGCGDVPCTTPEPFCYTWSRFGDLVFASDGDCPTPTPSVTPTPTAAPTATPTPTVTATPGGSGTFGDVDCSGGVNAVDALHVLRTIVGLLHDETCSASQDVDCNGRVNAVDALKLLRFAAGLSVIQQEPCFDIGSPLLP